MDWSGLNGNITYVFKNLTTVIFQHRIGSSPASIATQKSVNGSLWTLAPEIFCYVFLWGVVRFLKQYARITFFAMVLITISLQILSRYSDGLTLNQQLASLNTLLCAFSTGAFLASMQIDKLLQEKTYTIGLCALSVVVVLVSTRNWFLTGQIFWVITVIVFALRPCKWTFVQWLQRNDYSYGIYLLHFPLILVSTTFIGLHILNGYETAVVLCITYSVLLLAARLMWLGVEAKVLAIVKRNSKKSSRRYPQKL